MTVGLDRQCVLGTELNTVQLSIFSHRFMSIAGTLKISVEYIAQNKGGPFIISHFLYRTDG